MKENKLFKYIVISILIHALILFAFPLANQAGFGEKNETQDFGFIELVEYKPITQTSQEAGEKQNSEDKREKEETIEENQNIEEIEEEENNIEIDEETEEIKKDEAQETTVEKVNEQESQEVQNETEEVEEVNENTDSTSKNNNSEVISSEESDIEMEVEDKSQNNDENVTNQQNEEETETNTDTKNKPNPSEEEQEEEEAPPPPPTSGELIAKSITPQYPKDLVGENEKGTVKFVVNIDKTGELLSLTMTDSSGIEQIDKTSRLAIERGWEFKSYNMPYSIPIVVDFKINEAGNPVIDLNLGEVDFKEVNN